MQKIPLSASVHAEIRDGILLIITDNPPVNVLSADVRRGLMAGFDLLEGRDDLRAAVLLCEGKSFFAGADMAEFGGEIAMPDLPALITRLSQLSRPVVAAMHGTALGGGFELALAATARVAVPTAGMGLPEVTLGLLPAGGGIAQVTRLAGAEVALDLVLSGRRIGAEEARQSGLIDRIADGDLREAALALAGSLPARAGAKADPEAGARIAEYRRRNAAKLAGRDAPEEILRLIEMAVQDPDRDQGPEAREAFFRLEQGEQSRALRHVFAAERRLKDLPFLPAETQSLPVATVGVVGAGTMGSGIATVLVTAGFNVLLCDSMAEGLQRGLQAVSDNLAGAIRRGKMDDAARTAALSRLSGHAEPEALAGADLVIEAVFERLDVKTALFARLDAICKPQTILASNTSFLDIDVMAAATGRPDRVLGMHFFSPAHVMRLLEVVRGAKTSPEVIRTAVDMGRRMQKITVCVGNCHGFIGNRILLARQRAAMDLLLAGASPYDIDRAMTGFGLPMGPFQMADLAGLDVGWDRDGSAGRTMEEVFCEAGRFGMKNGLGYYDYDEKGRGQPSADAMALINAFRARHPEKLRDVVPEALLDHLLEPMLDQVDAIIAEGIALRPSDIDVVWVHGFGWPRWKGGPAWHRGHR